MRVSRRSTSGNSSRLAVPVASSDIPATASTGCRDDAAAVSAREAASTTRERTSGRTRPVAATWATGFQANPPADEWVCVAETHSAESPRPDARRRMASTSPWSASSRSRVTSPTRSSSEASTTARAKTGSAARLTSGRTSP
jgi:hypothetical protein